MSGARLELAARRAGVGFPVTLPVVGCAAGGLLYLAAADAGGGGAVLLALDADGRPATAARRLPLVYASALVPCAGGLVAVGARDGETTPVALGLSRAGEVLWEVEPELGGELGQWPQPACVADGAVAVWELRDATGTLCWTTLPRGARSAAAANGWSSELAAAGGRAAAAVARCRAGELELLRLAGGDAVPAWRAGGGHASSPALVTGPSGAALAWVEDGRRLNLVRFDAELRPQRVDVVAEAGAGATIAAVRLWADAGRLALAYRSDGLPDAPARPVRAPRQLVALADRPDAPVELDPPGRSFLVGAWVGEVLVVVHGGVEATVSVLRAGG